jgi:hypothetical protein
MIGKLKENKMKKLTPIKKAYNALLEEGVIVDPPEGNRIIITIEAAKKIYKENIEVWNFDKAREIASKAAGVPLIYSAINDAFAIIEYIDGDHRKDLSPYDDFVSRFVREYQNISGFTQFWCHLLDVNSFIFRKNGTVQEWLTEQSTPNAPVLVSDGIKRNLPEDHGFLHLGDPDRKYLKNECLMGTLPDVIETSWYNAINQAIEKLLSYTVQDAMDKWLEKKYQPDGGYYSLYIFSYTQRDMESHIQSRKNFQNIANKLSDKYGMKFSGNYPKDDIDEALKKWIKAKYTGYKTKTMVHSISPIEARMKVIEAAYLLENNIECSDRMSKMSNL